MGVVFEDKKIVLEGKVYENELESISKYFSENKAKVEINLEKCVDMHGAIVQLLLAYKSKFGLSIQFSDNESTYKMALEGFRTIEDDCNK